MTDILPLLTGALLVNHGVLTQYPGLRPLLGAASRLATTTGVAVATAVALALSSLLIQLAYHTVLLPSGLGFLRMAVSLVAIVAAVLLTALLLQTAVPVLQRAPRILLPLIATTCLVLAPFDDQTTGSVADALLHAVATGAGFAVALILFAAMQERVDASDVPAAFRGPAITLITAGLLTLACMGLAGLA